MIVASSSRNEHSFIFKVKMGLKRFIEGRMSDVSREDVPEELGMMGDNMCSQLTLF